MKKYSLIIAGLALWLASYGTSLAINDVTLGTSAVISVSSINLNVSGTQSVVDSLTVNADDFTVTMSGGASLKVSSADRRNLTITTAGSVSASQTSCTSSESVHTITNPTEGVQATTTVSVVAGSTCSGGGGSPGSAGGGGGGGGGGSSAPSPSPAPAPQPIVPRVITPIIYSTRSTSAVFTRPLSVGSTNDDVMRLQTLLATDSTVYPEGLTTGYFGPMTKRAVQRFQEKYGVTTSAGAGYGVFGPATRAKMQEVFGGALASPAALTSPSSGADTLTDLQARIKLLQDQLKQLQQ